MALRSLKRSMLQRQSSGHKVQDQMFLCYVTYPQCVVAAAFFNSLPCAAELLNGIMFV